MKFISIGDFGFPFQFIEYFNKHFFTWSFQNGTPNLDGIIRFISRLPILAIFYLTNNGLIAAYFYILLCVVVAFVSFTYFLKEFYGIQKWKDRIIPSLFFTINPIFLGNFAKIGLNLAVAMLPLILVCLKKYFDSGKFRYLIFVIIFLNISLIHPYTFTVNLGVAAVYFLYRIIAARKITLRQVKHIIIAEVIALLLNAYFILPIVQVGTINKDAIINTASQAQPTDYSSLISVANTETIFTAFTLSKDVLKDFDYYNNQYTLIYFGSIFLFYALLLFLIIAQYKHYSGITKLRLAILFILLLILLLLSTGVFLNIDRLLLFLSGLPGGWAFRSPLKWQLYIPIALGSVLAITLARSRPHKTYTLYASAFSILLILVNGYLVKDIVIKLLTPRHISQFQDFAVNKLDRKRLLFIRNLDCPIFEEELRDSVELNQLFQSHPVQVKTTESKSYTEVYLNMFDYIMTCDKRPYLIPKNFSSIYKNNSIKIYENKSAKPFVYVASATILIVGSPKDFLYQKDFNNAAYIFSNSDSNFITKSRNMIDGIQANALQADHLSVSPGEIRSQVNSMFLEPNRAEIVVDVTGGDSSYKLSQDLLLSEGVLKLQSPKITGKNLYPSGDFETNQTVNLGDCYNYDSTSLEENEIAFKYVTEATVGKRALYLQARRHLGCLAFPISTLNKNSDYFVSFKYKQLTGKQAQFVVYSNNKTITDQRMTLKTDKNNNWQVYSQILTAGTIIPDTKLYIYLPTDGVNLTSIQLDDFKIFELPHLPSVQLGTADNRLALPQLEYHRINDTKYEAEIRNLKEGRLLVFSDTYSPQWDAYVRSNKMSYKVPSTDHFLINGLVNGWKIDPSTFPESMRNSDNSYSVTIEYAPQRSFYVGLLISGLTLISSIGYVVWDWGKSRRKKKEVIIAPPWPSR